MASRLSKIVPLLAAGILWGQAGSIISNELEFLPDQPEEVVEELNSLLDNPLPLNEVASEELWFLPDSLVELLIDKRNQGPYTSWNDLRQRTRITPVIVEYLQEVLVLPADNLQGSISSRIVGSGTDERIRSKLVLNGEHWYSQGILQREPDANGLAKLATATVSYSRNRWRLTVGSHRLHWGNGLLLSGDGWGRTGKSLLSGSDGKYYVRPAYSTQRRNIMQGAAMSYSWSRLTVGSGLSNQQVNFITDPTGNIRPGSSQFNPAGDVGRERIGYALAMVTRGSSKLGYLVSQQAYTMGDDVHLRRVYQSATIQYKHIIPEGEVMVSSETALGSGSLAGVIALGLIYRPDEGGRFKLLAQIRRYPADWRSLKGVMPGFGTANGNGNGWYVGWSWLKAGMELAGYVDSYTALVATHESGWSAGGVSSGIEVSLPLAMGALSLRYSQLERRKGVAVDQLDGPVSYREQFKVAQQLRSKLLFRLAQTTQIDLFAAYKWTEVASDLSQGMVWGTSLQRSRPGGDQIGVGLVAYSTDDWESRIVAYQFGLPGEMNMRNLYGQGIEIYGRYWIKLAYGQISLRLSKRLVDSGQPESNSSRGRGGLQLDISL